MSGKNWLRAFVLAVLCGVVPASWAADFRGVVVDRIDDLVARGFFLGMYRELKLDDAPEAAGKALPWTVRLIWVADEGKPPQAADCGMVDTPTLLYLAAGADVRRSDAAVFRLSSACEYTFLRWIKLPQRLDPKDFAVLELVRGDPHAVRRIIQIRVNPYDCTQKVIRTIVPKD